MALWTLGGFLWCYPLYKNELDIFKHWVETGEIEDNYKTRRRCTGGLRLLSEQFPVPLNFPGENGRGAKAGAKAGAKWQLVLHSNIILTSLSLSSLATPCSSLRSSPCFLQVTMSRSISLGPQDGLAGAVRRPSSSPPRSLRNTVSTFNQNNKRTNPTFHAEQSCHDQLLHH